MAAPKGGGQEGHGLVGRALQLHLTLLAAAGNGQPHPQMECRAYLPK